MNKKTLLFAAATIVATAAQAQTFYQTDFAEQSEFEKWTVIDANADEKTWTFNADATNSHVFYSYGSVQADDWFISPEITIDQDCNIMVEYTTYGDSYGESMEVYLGNGTDVASMTELKNKHERLVGAYETHYFLKKAKAGEKLHVGFHATTKADAWRLYLSGFTVKAVQNSSDIRVKSITSPTSAYGLGQETVTVEVANDGLTDLSKFDIAFKVNNGDEVRETANLDIKAGETKSYTFQNKADLSTPRELYTLSAYTLLDEDINHRNDTTQTQIRHKAPATLPYKMGFEAKEYTEEYKFFNLNEDDGDWNIYTYSGGWFDPRAARTGISCLAYNYNKLNDANDWVITEPIQIDEAGTYVFRFWYSAMDDRNTEKLEVYWGNEQQPDGMTNLVYKNHNVNNPGYKESINLIKFDKPQTVYFGFKAVSEKNKNWLVVDDIEMYKASDTKVDVVLDTITLPFEYVREPNNKNVSFDVQNAGLQSAITVMNVYVDGVLTKAEPITFKAQERRSFTAPDAIAELTPGEHTVKVELLCSSDERPENNVLEKKIYVLGKPAYFYNFEDNKTPDDFTFYVQDKGTINSGAGDEWNKETGWGIVPLGATHTMYGNYTFGCTTYLDFEDPTDHADRWVVLPRVKVNSKDSYFVWDASSYNESYRESYNIKVSDESGDPKDWWYSTVKTIYNEGITPSTRGVSLAQFEGKSIYIAINPITKSGDILILDNIGIYGDVVSGIGEIETDADAKVNVNGNTLTAEGAKSITLSDANGRLLFNVAGDKADISSLPAGVYIATYLTANGAKSAKFVK